MSQPTLTVFYDKNTRQPQPFSLPKPIIYYLAKNVNSIETYEKLTQACKYFYATNQVHFLPCLYFKAYDGSTWKTCSIDSPQHICETKKLKKDSPKLWLTQSFRFYANVSTPQTLVAEMIPKIYRSSVNRLIISSQILSFDEVLFLAPEVTHFHFHYVHVKYNNGKTVQLEDIVEKLPRLEILKYKFFRNDPSVSSKTAKNLIKIPHFKNLSNLSFYNLSPKFNFNTFYLFIFKNKQIKFDATFRDFVSTRYQKSFEAYINKAEYLPDNNNNVID